MLKKYNKTKFKVLKFSLTELLLVASMIVILMSLLMPALRKVRESGLTIQCKKNLQSLSTGVALYIDDNENIVTPLCQGRSLVRANWANKTKYYMGNYGKEASSPYQCPSSDIQHDVSTYSMPIYNGCAARSEARYAQVPLFNVNKPEEAMILADNRYFVHRYDYYNGDREYVFRHEGGQNRLYLDGHVQYAVSNYELPNDGYWWKWALGKGH